MTRELRFTATESSGEVTAILTSPKHAKWLLVLAHGAGAGMRHAFMEAVAERLAGRGVATFRYQFPYMEKGSKRPNPQPILLGTVRSAVDAAADAAAGVPIFAGGKSMGGRMTSLAFAKTPLTNVRGLVFFGFPLHAAGKPSSERAAHLDDVTVPMLFLQGTRDSLARLDALRPVCERLGARATLHVVDDGDHSFRVLKRTGRTNDDVMDELAGTVAEWTERMQTSGWRGR